MNRSWLWKHWYGVDTEKCYPSLPSSCTEYICGLADISYPERLPRVYALKVICSQDVRKQWSKGRYDISILNPCWGPDVGYMTLAIVSKVRRAWEPVWLLCTDSEPMTTCWHNVKEGIMRRAASSSVSLFKGWLLFLSSKFCSPDLLLASVRYLFICHLPISHLCLHPYMLLSFAHSIIPYIC